MKKVKGKRITGLFKAPFGVPEKMRSSFRYNTTFLLNAAAAVLALQEFRVNSLFDFDLTGVGHQPTPFDQMANFYNRFRVLTGRFRLRSLCTSTDPVVAPAEYGLVITQSSGLLVAATYEDIVCSRWNSGLGKVGNDNRVAAPLSGPASIWWSGVTYYGKKYLVEDDFSHTYNGNPTIGPILTAYASSTDGATDPAALTLELDATFTAECFDPKMLFMS